MAKAKVKVTISEVKLTLSEYEAKCLAALIYSVVAGHGEARSALTGISVVLQDVLGEEYQFSNVAATGGVQILSDPEITGY